MIIPYQYLLKRFFSKLMKWVDLLESENEQARIIGATYVLSFYRAA